MSEGNRDRHGPIMAFAVTVCFLIFALIGWYEGFKRGQESHQGLTAEAYTEQAEVTIQKTCLVLSDAAQVECIGEAIGSAREQQRAEEDLDAQQQMAEWARWMLTATVVMGVVTALGVVFVWQTLEATRQMALDTRRIGEAQVRAYLSITDLALSIDATSSHPTISIKVKNSGQSPATRIEVVIEFSFFTDPRIAGFAIPERRIGVLWLNDIPAGQSAEPPPTTLADVSLDKDTLRDDLSGLMGIHIDVVVYADDVFGKDAVAFGHYATGWTPTEDKQLPKAMLDFSSVSGTKYLVEKLRRKDRKT